MTEDPFDRLLDAMPKIAQVVNEFRSEEVQRRAFEALPPGHLGRDRRRSTRRPDAGPAGHKWGGRRWGLQHRRRVGHC